MLRWKIKMRCTRITQGVSGIGLCLLAAMLASTQYALAQLAQNQQDMPAWGACGNPSTHFTARRGSLTQIPEIEDRNEARVYFIEEQGTPYTPGQHIPWGPVVKIGLNGKWVGATTFQSYALVLVPAGENHFCVRVQYKSSHSFDQVYTQSVLFLRLQAKAGQSYYVDATLFPNVLIETFDFSLTLVNPDEGKLLLAESLPAVWKEIQPKPIPPNINSNP